MTTKKEEQRRRKAHKKALRQEREKRASRTSLSKKFILGCLSGVISILGIASAIVNLLPKLSVSPSSSVDPHAAFGTIFNLKNDGIIGVHDVTFSFCPGTVYEPTTNTGVIGGKMAIGNWRADDLAPGDSVGLPFEQTYLGFPNAQVDAVFVISFRPGWWPWTREQRFRFTSERSTDGTWQWKEMPVGDRCRKGPPWN